MKISYLNLGATLFIPAAFNSLNAVVNEKKYPELRSLVIDFEDGLNAQDIDKARKNVKEVLKNINKKSPLVFIRARSVEQLEEILKFENIKNITGFVLAKFSLLNAEGYFELLQNSNYYIMPSIEGAELFEQSKLLRLREIIISNKRRVLLVRFGLEDMLRQLGMWRKKGFTAFDISAANYVLGGFISLFKSSGFAISGGVYPYFKDKEGFAKDVQRDLDEGLFSKTIIHPSQISIVHKLYRVGKNELSKANEIIKRRNEAVYSHDGSMIELSTMYPYALELSERAHIYGITKL